MVKIAFNTDEATLRDTGKLAENVALKDKIIHALRSVLDPELPVNIYDLGLIYKLDIVGNEVKIEMTLTAPNCPVAEEMPAMVHTAVMAVADIKTCTVKLVWEPKWDKLRMSEAALLECGLF
jgi:FeS assembly SUF system protein